ncbi:hypothetical protein [Streptomyces tagetis]|uniref:Uncharacterized protein n=1 Tax=Streptomyces tagetis TaxID=2820809 RepID=A0A940XKF1_9ACTN|nr:hypothetical protein [Streptomyces sp. RG38]MBQ0830131.1 hypothetical protein [Streptomyces sp. RG38]
MTAWTSALSIQHIPWSPAETAAYRALVDHLGGTETTPPCPGCNKAAPDCETGTRLRRALRDATRARCDQGRPAAER